MQSVSSVGLAVIVLLSLSGCGTEGKPGEHPVSQPTPTKPGPQKDPCATASLGDGGYCGRSLGADENTLFHCASGKGTSEPCPHGCHVAAAGIADYCEEPSGYQLPWTCGSNIEVTQGNHGDICGSNGGDHTGVQEYAFDFGLQRHTRILASRGGVITVAANLVSPGQGCYDGCSQTFGTTEFWDCCNTCLTISNHVNIKHTDGSVATYWHMDHVEVRVGQTVSAGDPLGYSGTSGCSTGPHLHFQVMQNCPEGYCQSKPIHFGAGQAPVCGAMVTSANNCKS